MSHNCDDMYVCDKKLHYLGIRRYVGESIYIYANGKKIEIKLNEKKGSQCGLLVIAERDVLIARSEEVLNEKINKKN